LSVIAGVAGAHRHAQFAVGLEAAVPGAVPGTRIDHHERNTGNTGGNTGDRPQFPAFLAATQKTMGFPTVSLSRESLPPNPSNPNRLSPELRDRPGRAFRVTVSESRPGTRRAVVSGCRAKGAAAQGADRWRRSALDGLPLCLIGHLPEAVLRLDRCHHDHDALQNRCLARHIEGSIPIFGQLKRRPVRGGDAKAAGHQQPRRQRSRGGPHSTRCCVHPASPRSARTGPPSPTPRSSAPRAPARGRCQPSGMIRGQLRPGLAREVGPRGHLHGKIPPMPTQHSVRLQMDQQFQLGEGKPGPDPLDQAFSRHLRHAEVVGERVGPAGVSLRSAACA